MKAEEARSLFVSESDKRALWWKESLEFEKPSSFSETEKDIVSCLLYNIKLKCEKESSYIEFKIENDMPLVNIFIFFSDLGYNVEEKIGFHKISW